MDDSNSFNSCSICLDLVADCKERSVAKLQCGHEFHLDCIGSAFNMKGAMQCPNCRKIEDGRWLYANGSSRSLPDFGIDDWTFSEEPYEYTFPEMPFGVHWCPFSGLTGVHSSFEEVDPPSTTYHELQGNHAIFAEHVAASTLAHSHVAYVRPIPRALSNASENVDETIFSHRRNAQSGHNEIYNPNVFPAMNVQYQSWGHHSPPISANRNHLNGIDQASVPPTLRSTRVEADAISRSGPFGHPFLHGPGSFPRARSPFVPSLNHSVNNTRPHERIQVSHPPQGNPTSMISPIMPGGVRRFSGPQGLPLMMPALPHADHQGGFYIFPPGSSGQNLHEAENREHLSRFPVVLFDRDQGWGSLRHASGGIDSSNRSGNFWRQWS